jgi:hypothetical protein
VHGFIDPFYRQVGRDEQTKEPGHIWLDQPIYMPPRHGLRISRVDANDDRQLEMAVCGRTDDTFNHPPINSLKLESTEAAVIAKAKKDRPVIILGGLSAAEPLAGAGSLSLAETVLCVPVYGGDQFTSAQRERIRAYECSNLFYLPADRDCGIDEGWARLDHVQPIASSMLSRHKGAALSDDALAALHEWFVHYATGEIDDDSLIVQYRRDELLRLKKE